MIYFNRIKTSPKYKSIIQNCKYCYKPTYDNNYYFPVLNRRESQIPHKSILFILGTGFVICPDCYNKFINFREANTEYVDSI